MGIIGTRMGSGENFTIRNFIVCTTVRMIRSRRLRRAGNVARMEEGRSFLKIVTGRPIGKRPLGRPRRRWEDNIRMDLKDIGANTRNWLIRLRIGIIGELL